MEQNVKPPVIKNVNSDVCSQTIDTDLLNNTHCYDVHDYDEGESLKHQSLSDLLKSFTDNNTLTTAAARCQIVYFYNANAPKIQNFCFT